MKTKHDYIYEFKPIGRAQYFLVRFRDNKGNYVQATFGNSNDHKEALSRAITWRDKHLSPHRKLNSRLLLNKPLRNKTSNLPAGITYTSYKIKRKRKFYTYRFFYITAGMDENREVIYKKVYVTKNRSYTEALRDAKRIRKEIAVKYKKTFRTL